MRLTPLLGRIVAAAEPVKNKKDLIMQRHLSKRTAGVQGPMPALGPTFRLRTLSLAVAMACGGLSVNGWAQALPTGGQVSAGAASISQPSANKMVVNQTTDKVAINWQSFNIGAGNTVQFVQPATTSIALNRVIGNSRSEIYGNLSSNGQVFLINGNGVLFGPSAQVDVGGLVASTLNITDQNFLAGNYVFSDPNNTASVVNQGTLRTNGGGYLALIGSQVINTGTMQAQLGSVVLGAGGTAQLTLNDNRLIKFEVQQGALNALAENGGLIQANGGRVILTAGAADELLASTVNNTGVIEAQTVQSQPGNILLLAGMKSGTTNVGGTLDASAPAALNPNGGDGGFIETSGGTVNIASDAKGTTAASAGLTGTWLVDPSDYTIAASGGNMTGATLSSIMAGSNFTINSSAGGNSGSGDVNINDNVSWSASTWLTINAAHSINFGAVMTLAGASKLTMYTNAGNGGDAPVGGGSINMAVNGAGGFAGRIDIPGRSGTGFLYLQGLDATVINSLGSWGSTTGTDLQGIQGNLNGLYVLGSDIDASATSTASWYGPNGYLFSNGFRTLGYNGGVFKGTLDGLGHTIRNLAVASSTYHGFGDYGLFSRINNTGVVQNLGLVGGGLLSGGSGTVHNVGGIAGENSGTIRNTFNTGGVTGTAGSASGGLVGYGTGGSIIGSYGTGNVFGFDAGGLVGLGSGGSIVNSYATGNISGIGNTGGAGGLAGQFQGTITNSSAFGAVSNSSRVGGLVGTGGGTITTSHAHGTVTGVASGSNAGGLAGFWNGNITNSFSSSNVIASGSSSIAGGLVGSTTSGINATNTYATGNVNSGGVAGGLIGFDINGNILTSFASGNVSGNNDVGGLVGIAQQGRIQNTYATGSVSGNSYVGGLVGDASAITGSNGGNISISYANNVVTGNSHVGGLVGNGTMSSGARDLYWNVTLSGQSASGFSGSPLFAGDPSFYVTGLTAAQMLQFGSYYTGSGSSVWNLSSSGGAGTTWRIYSGDTAPLLEAFLTPLTITANNVTKVYDATSVGLTNVSYSLASAAGSSHLIGFNTPYGSVTKNNVGTYAANVWSDQLGYDITLNGGGLTVTPATLTGSGLTAQNKVYDGTAAATVTGGLSGIKGSDSVALTTAAFASKNVANSINVTGLALTGADAGNYTFSAPALSANITPATLTVTANSASRVYGAADPALSGSVTGFVNGETLATATTGSEIFSTTATVGSNVGTYGITGSGLTANNGNYVFAQAAGNSSAFTINPATLTVTANSAGRTYGAANPALSGTVTGFVNGDTLATATTGTEVFSTTATTGSNVGTYSITGSGLTANHGNYVFAQAVGNSSALTINPATLTVTANAASRLYGAANPVLSGTVTGFVNGQTLATATTGTEVFSTTATSGSNVGTYSITGSGLVANNGNYVFAQAVGNSSALTINPATLTVTANSASRTYGAANPVFSGSVTGFVNGDTLATATTGSEVFSSTATTGSNVGTYSIIGSGLTANNGNYVFVQAPANTSALTIDPATLTMTADTLSRTYGAANPALSGSVTGFVNGDTLATATTGNEVFSTTATAGSNVGSYGIIGSGLTLNNGNYVIVQAPGNATALTVNPATLTVTANTASRAYGAADPVFSGSVTGFVNGDTLATATTGTEVFSTNAGTLSNVGSYGITGSGLTANSGNYVFAQASGNASALTINPAVLTVSGLSLASTTRQYDGSAQMLLTGTGTLNGLVGNQTLTLGNYATLAGPDVGSQAVTRLVSISDGAGGGLASNYTLVQPSAPNVTITQLPSATWVGGSSGNWSNPANWAPSTNLAALGAVPSLSNVASVVIPAGVAVTYDNLPGNTVLNTLNAGSGGAFTFNGGSLSVGSGSLSLASLTLNSGTLNMGAGVNVGSYVQNGGAWRQVGATLPAFSADNFSLYNGTFLRALGGNGSSASPYQLTDLYGVQGMRGLSGSSFVLLNDIDATATANWNNGMGFLPIDLNGSFDGQGHSVNDITINVANSGFVGFFSRIEALGSVNNFGLRGGTVSGPGSIFVGGLAGTNYGTITNSYASPVVAGGYYVGGLVGNNSGNGYGNSIAISNSYATGRVTGLAYVGGLVGYNSSTISNSYATGAVQASNYIGGGLVGYDSGTITKSYATGAVTGRYGIGAFAGQENSSYGRGNFYDKTVNPGLTGAAYGTPDTAGSIWGLSTADMRNRSNFNSATAANGGVNPGWDMTGTWLVYDSYTAPLLRPFLRPLTVTVDNATKTYDGLNSASSSLSYSSTPDANLLGTAAYSTSGVNVGTYALGVNGLYSNQDGYAISYVPGNLTINPASLTVTANAASRTYGSANPVLTGTVTGLVNGETLGSAATGNVVFSTTATLGSNVGSYDITGSGLTVTNSNYVLVQAPGNASALTVTPATLTVTANPASRTYGTANPSMSGTVTGFVNGETLATATTGTEVFSSSASGTSNVGAYDITGAGLVANNGNYVFVQAPGNAGALTVTPASLTVTASNASKTYGQTPVLTGFTSSGLQNGETIGSVTETSAGTAGTASVAGGPYTITASNATGGTFSAGNYNISYVDGSLTVNPASLTVTAASISKTYGQTPVLTGFTSSGLQNGETIGSVTEFSAGTAANAGVAGGPYAITASNASGGTFNAGNYNITYADGSLTVNPASLTVTAANVSKTYGQTPVLTGFTSSGLQNGETIGSVTETSAGTAGSAGVAGGPYAIVAGGATGGTFDAANYNINYVNGSLTVNPASLTVTASNVSKTYGQMPVLAGFTSSGLQNGETIGSVTEISAGTAGTAGVAGGPYAIVASNAAGGTFDAANYSINYVNGSLTVNPASLTVTASNASKTYGQTPTLTGFTSSGLQNGETIGSVTETSAGTAGTAGVAGGPYAIVASNAAGGTFSSGNYNITYVNGSLTVNPASLTVTASNASKTYGQTPTLTGFTSSGLQNGETIGSVTEVSAGTAGTAGVAGGPYTITASNAAGGTFDAANYNISYINGSLTVNPASLTVTASNVSKTYGQTPVLTGFTSSGLQNGETIGSVTETSAGTAGTAGVVGGPYAIVASNAAGGTFDAANYTIVYNPGTLTVTPALLTITAANASKTYGQTPVLTGFTSSGLQNGETIGSVTETSAGTSSTASVAGGPYAITASNASGGTFNTGNYTITYADGSLTVNPASLTVTASNASKVYGQTPVLTGFTSSGLQNGETIGSVTEISAGTTGTASVSSGPYAIIASGATGGTFDASNYTIAYGNGSLMVTPAPLTVTASNASKTYGQTPVLTGFTSSGLQNGETIGGVAETSAGTAAAASVAGGPYAISASNATGGTFNAGNYNIVYNDGSLTVAPATLTVSANAASRTYGAANPALSGTVTGFVNGETLATATTGSEVFSSSATGTSNVGSYDITGAGLTANNGNYVFVQAPGNASALAVTPAPLTISAANASKTYGQTPVLTGFTSSGLQNGETIGGVTETSAGTAANAGVAGGPYTIIASNATGGTFSAGNYNITYADGSLTVNPAPLTVTASNASKTYGQTPVLTGFTSSGLQNGETIGSVTETSAGTAANASVAGGPYAITASNATGGTFDAANYRINYANGSLSVTPAPLTITANSYTKTYDGLAYSGGNGVWYSGYVNGENGSVLGGHLIWGGTAQGAVAAGGYTLTPGGLTSSNYVISYVDGALLINSAPPPVTGLSPGAQGAVTAATQTGQGTNGAGSGNPADWGGFTAGSQGGTSLAGNGQDGGAGNGGQENVNQSAALFPGQESQRRGVGRSAAGQLITIVGSGQKLPEGVE